MSEAPGRGRDERFVLAVDLGSSVAKVGLVSLRGAIAWWSHGPLETVRGADGSATQDADEWWRIIVDATRRGLAETSVHGDQVVAVGVTGQFASVVPVDRHGRPVDSCVMWMDTRGEPHARQQVGGRVQGYRLRAVATWVRRTGGAPSPEGVDSLGHMLHIERDQPHVAAAARWYLEPVDYITMRFTGVAAASHASMTGAWLTDNRRLDVLAYDDKLVAMAGIDATKLAPLVPTGSVIGTVLASVADELGISRRAQVVTGVTDVHSAAVGSGCVRDYEAHMGFGTTSWISCPVPKKKTDLLRQMAAVPGLTNDSYLLVNNQLSAGRCLQWFREEVAGSPWHDELPTYEALTALAATAPPGSGGVIFTPWLAGEKGPVEDGCARGGFHNLSLSSDLADLTRAVLEGVAYNARWLLNGAEHFTGRRLDPIRLIGGCARSDLWSQILADVLDRRIERVEAPLLSGLRGSALLAATALDEVARDEVRDLVRVERAFEPDPGCRAVYDRQSTELPRLYKAQKAMFGRLNRT
jgi:xylulokinase